MEINRIVKNSKEYEGFSANIKDSIKDHEDRIKHIEVNGSGGGTGTGGGSVDLTPVTNRLDTIEPKVSALEKAINDAKGSSATLKAKLDSMVVAGGGTDLGPIEDRLTLLEDGLYRSVGDADTDVFTGKILILLAEHNGSGEGSISSEIGDITILKSNGKRITEDEVELVNGYTFGTSGTGDILFHRGFYGATDLFDGGDQLYSTNSHASSHNDTEHDFTQIYGVMWIIKFKEEQSVSKIDTMLWFGTDDDASWQVMLSGAADLDASYDKDTGEALPDDEYYDYITDVSDASDLGHYPDIIHPNEDTPINILFGPLNGYALWDEVGDARLGYNTLSELTEAHEVRLTNIEDTIFTNNIEQTINEKIEPIRNSINELNDGLIEFIPDPDSVAVKCVILNIERVSGSTNWDIYFGKIKIKKDDDSFVTASDCDHAWAYGYNSSGDISKYKEMLSTINTESYENIYGSPQGVHGHYVVLVFKSSIKISEIKFYVRHYNGSVVNVKYGVYNYDSFNFTSSTPTDITSAINDMISNKSVYGSVSGNNEISRDTTVIATDFDGSYLTIWDDVRDARGTHATLLERLDAMEATNRLLQERIIELETLR